MCCANFLSSSVAVFAFCVPTPAAHASWALGARGTSEAAHRSLPLAQSCDAAPSPCRPRGIRQDIIRRFDRARVSRHHSCVPVREAAPEPACGCALRVQPRGGRSYVHYVRSRSLVHRLRYNFLHTCKAGLTRPTHDTTETTVQRNPPTRVTRDRTRACAPQPQRHTSLDPGQSHEVKHSAPETQTQGVAALQTHCHGAPGCTNTLAHQHGGRAPSTDMKRMGHDWITA